jgi:polysaccharide deacetylase family protein (PEP-CTERM system associated)
MDNNTSNFLTFDIEEFFHAELIARNIENINTLQTNIESNIEQLISICDRYNVKSTCFVVGDLAEKKPHIVRKLFEAGHEIASHGYSHKLVYSMTPDEFEADLKKSINILEDITGAKVKGYRAPSWSVNESCIDWYYDVLKDNGLIYSSSVFPGKNFLYGIKNAPQKIHLTNNGLVEIPQATIIILTKRLGFAGGVYLRIFPFSFINNRIKTLNKKNKSVFIYAHPYEIEGYIPRIKMPLLSRIIQYYNLSGGAKKLKSLIKENSKSFVKIEDFISKNEHYEG